MTRLGGPAAAEPDRGHRDLGAFGCGAAALFAFGGRPALVAGGVLLYLGFVLDCVDGQLARYTRHFSVFGGWLDTIADRAKEYLVYAGSRGRARARAGLGDAWSLAIAAIGAADRPAHDRHLVRRAARRGRPARPGRGRWRRPAAGPRAGSAPASGRVRADTGSAGVDKVQADTGSVAYWLKRTVVSPDRRAVGADRADRRALRPAGRR